MVAATTKNGTLTDGEISEAPVIITMEEMTIYTECGSRKYRKNKGKISGIKSITEMLLPAI